MHKNKYYKIMLKIKSKAILALAGLMVAAFVLATVPAQVSADTITLPSNGVKKSSGVTTVMALQQFLNWSLGLNLSVDGQWGAKTTAAVKLFQSKNGLTPDGVFGAMSAAKAMSLQANQGNGNGNGNGNGSMSGNFPPGCVSASGFSTVSGQPCSSTNSNNSGSGCPAGAIYNPMTGALCTGSTPVVTSGPLSINNVSAVSGFNATSVGVGQTDKIVGDMRIVTGAGGTGTLTGLNVSFYNRGTGDYQFTKYVQNVSIWLNNTKVGSMPASQFSQYNSVYSAFVPVNGVLASNTTNDLKISVDALPVIDTANMTADLWVVDVTSLRYTDSTGSFNYSPSNIFGNSTYMSGTGAVSNSTANFQFASAASAQNIKLTVTRDTTDATDRIVSGSVSSNTNLQTLAVVDLYAQGSDITVRRLPVDIAVGGGATTPTNVVNTLRLFDANGNQLDSESVPTGSTPVTVTFQNFNLIVKAGTTLALTVKGDFNTVDGSTLAAGAYAQVNVSSTDVGNIQAYDQGSNVISGSTYLTGSTTGAKVYIYVNGISVTATSQPTGTYAPPGGGQTHGTLTFNIPFSVTAFGSIAYMPSTAAVVTSGTVNAPTASAAANVQFAVDNGSALLSGATGSIRYTGSDTMVVDSNGNYVIPVGQTKNFVLTVTYAPTTAGSFSAQLVNVNWNTTDSSVTYSTFTAGLNSNMFRTSPVGGS
jgi:peptidoglycan hydrolase-like protein with peptidoglycan-binding domain